MRTAGASPRPLSFRARFVVILGLDPTRVTHPNRAKGHRVRGSLFGSVRHPAVPLSPAAACRSGTRGPGTLASVWILGHVQESKHSNTEETGRTTEFTEQTRIAARRAERYCFPLRELCGPPCFLRVKTLTSYPPNAFREEACILKGSTRGSLSARTTPVRRDFRQPNQHHPSANVRGEIVSAARPPQSSPGTFAFARACASCSASAAAG
jgi:hypothetical protein